METMKHEPVDHHTSYEHAEGIGHEHLMNMDEQEIPEKSHQHKMGGHMMHMGNLKKKFWISLMLAVPIIILSPMMGIDLPFQLHFPGSDWVVLVLASVLFFYGGKPFLRGAVMEIKDKSPAMMTLISMGITVAYLYSLYAFIYNHIPGLTNHKMDFFWELATLIVIMLLGHWIEMNAVGNAGNALQKMAELLPGMAHLVLSEEKTEDVPLKEIRIDQQVLVKPGEKIPVDGSIISGSTSVNESMVTGEARRVRKEKGDKVIGGSINEDGMIVVKVTGTGESGYLAQVVKLVSRAQQEKSAAESFSDKVAKALFYVALSVGVIAFIIWLWLSQDLNTALERMVTVFVIACPHALGLAIPLVIARSTSLGASHGLLLRNRKVLETTKKISVITMDKTGTLTEGIFQVSDVRTFSSHYTENDILTIAGALESGSNHPLSAGILHEIKKQELVIPKAEGIRQISGVGLSGVVNQKKVMIVNENYLKKNHLSYDKDGTIPAGETGDSVSYLLVDDQVVGRIAQSDRIKPDSQAVIHELKKKGIHPVMLTGDNETAANGVARELNIDEVYAAMLPEDKEVMIEKYRKQGKVVMMVGDGVNDAPALVRADIGIAIGAGTDVAIDAADVVLVKSNPSDILHFLSLAGNTNRKMIQNLWWGAGYNIIAIPLAAGILAPIGIMLSPAVGAVLMSVSTVVVAANALTLQMK
ncbi:MAG: copper-translocating P-type ATPase [Bacteroidales bacterium]|jgi:Cu2+-exporting ATPase|nr:copper-translocating P-type ATPase [Bacteroidales bacterium]